MLGTYFYHEIIRKTVIGFGTLFNNVRIRHQDRNGGDLTDLKVPIAYGPTQKFLARIEQQSDLNKSIAMTLPRMSFEMTSIDYDATRKAGVTQTFRAVDGNSNMKKVYMPVPYNIGFELSILSKLNDDALQIVEQILPYFQPSFSVTLNMIPDMNEKRDVAIVLNNIGSEDEWDDSFMQRRYIAYTLNFTMKSYLYGPYNTSDVIKKAIIHETIGDLAVNRRVITRSYTPKAVTDINEDGVIDVNDDILVDAGDDFGFNEGIEFL